MRSDFVSALNSTGYQFKHYAWSKAPSGTYGTYSEDGQTKLSGNNGSSETALVVYVALFTKDDTDTPRTTMETAFNSVRVAWYLNTVQYEDDTGYIHYEWVCEV